MPAEVLEILVTEDARYLDANDALYEVLGYTREQLRALPFGTLAGIEPEAAQALWRNSIRDHLSLPTGATTDLVDRRGGLHPVVYLGVRPAQDEQAWWSRFRLVSRRRVAVNQPMILQWILGQWRDAERRIAQLPAGHPDRRELEEDVAELRALYAHEQARRRGG